jgi:RNA polymerase sigma factor (sigma-70 family)
MMDLESPAVALVTPLVAFDDFFREQFTSVARTAALIVRDRSLGPDIAQEAFVRAYERWELMDSSEHARNFVYRAAINLARSHRRRILNMPLGRGVPFESRQDDPTAGLADWIVVTDALGKLSPRQRACVVLTDYVDLDAATIARILGIGEGTVRVHLMRGRRSIRNHLSLADEEES